MQFSSFLAACIALLMAVGAASAEPQDSLKDLNANKWTLGFTAERGFCLDYNGVNIIRTSTLVVHNGQFMSQYFNYSKKGNRVSVKDVPQGKEVTIEHTSKTFNAVHTVTLLPDKVIFKFDYSMPEGINDGRMDYCLGYLSAQPFEGRHYFAKNGQNEISSVIPLHWRQNDENFAPGLYRDITFDSTLGKLNIHIDGDLDGQQLLDFRSGAITAARRTPILWSGLFQKRLEGGRKYSQTATISIEPAAPKALPSRIGGNKTHVQPIKKVQAPPNGDILIIPEPKKIKLLGENFKINSKTRIVVAKDATEKDYSGARQFAAEVADVYGLKVGILNESQVRSAKNVILVGELARNRMLAKAAKANNITPPTKNEGYVLKATPDQVLVAGYDTAGSFYGMQTLRQLLRSESGQVVVRGYRVDDWPSLKFRGVLLFSGKDAWPFHKKLIDRILTKYKYNCLVLECSYMQWKTNPQMATDFAEPQDLIKKEIAYARDNFLEVIPEISTLGHMEWFFKNKQNLNLAEDLSYPYAYCPSKPETYDTIYKCLDEVIDLFKPKYFHLGHDEVAMVAEFPHCDLCKQKSMTELFGEDIRKLHDYIAKRGVRPIIWGDMLLARGDATSAANAPDPIESAKRRSLIPKDIIITDWHYSPAPVKEYTSPKIFQNEGFDVIASTWYDPRNIAGFTAAAKRDGIMGHLLTLWVGYNSNEDNLKKEKEQFNAMVLGGEFAWNDAKVTLEELPYNPNEVFDSSYNRKGLAFVTRDGFVTDLRQCYNVKLADNPQGSGWIGLGPNEDLSAAPVGLARLKGIEFRLADSTQVNSAIRVASTMDIDAIYPTQVNLPLNAKAHSLLFLHTTARFDETGKKAGAYIVHYSDGTQVEVPLIYGENITAWNDPQECPGAVTVWATSGVTNEKVLLRVLEWVNPSPQKTITSVDMVSANTESGPALLGISGTK